MSASCQLSQSRLVLLCSATLVLGADLILICWRLADGQSIWIPALGGFAMLCASFSVLLEATKPEGVG